MLGQNHKENHRIKFELVVEQVNITCADISKTAEINNICLQLVFHGELNFCLFYFDRSWPFLKVIGHTLVVIGQSLSHVVQFCNTSPQIYPSL